MKHFYLSRIFLAALLAGLFMTQSASAQQKEYTDGVFMLNEGSYGNERATINFLDCNGTWEYRLPITMNGETIQLGTTGCYATICGDNMYIVSKKMNVSKPDESDPTFVVCDAKTMKGKAVINSIKTAYGAADGRAFLPMPNLKKGYLSTTNGVYVISLENYTVLSQIDGTGGYTNNQTGNMIYRDGKVYAVDKKCGLFIIDAANDKLLKTINNEGEEGTYCSIVEAKDGSIWLTAGKKAGGSADHIVKFDPVNETTENITLPSDVKQPTNNWGAWNPDCFTASTTENALFWNGETGSWSNNGQYIYKFDVDSRTTTLLLDFTTAEAPQPYVYGAACRVNPDNGDLYLSITKGSAWGNESELRVYDTTDGTMKTAYPMEKHYWYPEMPVFSLKSSTNGITGTQTSADVREIARFTIDGKRINQPQRGINIVKYSDGTVKKVVVK